MSKIEIQRRQALGLLGALVVGCGRGGVDASKDEVEDALERRLSPTGAVPDVVRVGITPSLGQGTSDKLAPLYAYLAERLGRRVEGHTAKSYDDLAVMVRDQKVELAVLELFHDRCFFGRLEATMNKPHLQIWQTFRQLLRSHFRRLALQRF